MRSFQTERKLSALEAKFEANKIAFAPVVFQATKVMRDLGMLDLLFKHRKKGISLNKIAEAANVP